MEPQEHGRGWADHPAAWAKEVATVVDPLLAEVWSFAWAREAADAPASLPTLLRMAYLQGYRDALEEDERGRVLARLGVEVPEAKPTPRPAARSRRARGSSSSSGS